jgi:two-component system cell cycle response regulator
MAHLVLAEESSTVHKIVELCFNAENVEVHCFSDRNSTLDYLKTQPVDVLLTEVSGPNLDGYELCRKIKQDPSTAHVPVILLLGPHENYSVDRAKQVGCDRCLRKPLRALELVETVKELLSIPGAVASQDRLQASSGELGILVEPPPSEGSADVFSLTPLQCRMAPFSPTRELIEMGQKIRDEGDGNSTEALFGKEEMDRLADQLVALVRRELPRLLGEVSSD